ncbi:MAG: squalene/phytoene synthase family protein [Phenylobacterium sp.]|nr:squalene/phytoene synthase family protein [Phenylobacterium sp.]
MSDDLDDLIRRVDPDRWLSSRFVADAARRADVIAIYAYDHELARAPRVASNPLLGEIRLTWWREALDEIYEGRHIRHHPTAQALAQAVLRRAIPRAPLEAMIDGRYRELDAAPMTDDEALTWAQETAGRAAQAVAHVLDPDGPTEPAVDPAALWALGRRASTQVRGLAGSARVDAARLGFQAFPAVAHATLVLTPARSEIGRRLRVTWAVARGRI